VVPEVSMVSLSKLYKQRDLKKKGTQHHVYNFPCSHTKEHILLKIKINGPSAEFLLKPVVVSEERSHILFLFKWLK
jgi:hypothetical protein